MGDDRNATNREQAAREALSYFHNYATVKYPENYSMPFSGLLSQLNSKTGTWLNHFGGAIFDSELSPDQIEEAMVGVAQAGQGRVPKGGDGFFQALQGGVLGNVSWLAAVSETAGQIGDQLKETASDLGDAAKTTLFIAPFVLGAAVLIFVFYKSKA